MMMKKFYEEDTLLAGIDSGNTRFYVSYLNREGDITDFEIPTVIAPAPQTRLDGAKQKSDVEPEKMIHIAITSGAMNGTDKKSTWYVGDYAKTLPDAIQPSKESSASKFIGDEKGVYVVPTLAALAIAAAKEGKSSVTAPLAVGLPVSQYQNREQVFKTFQGRHQVEFLDGPFFGKMITIDIDDSEINQEGVTASTGLFFKLSKGEIEESKLATVISEETFAMSDLGGGTLDNVFFDEDGAPDRRKTNSEPVGTNRFVDDLLKAIEEDSQFEKVRVKSTKNKKPFKSREEFIDKVVKKEVLTAIKEKRNPKFIMRWGVVKEADITELVLKYMKLYVEEIIQYLHDYYSDVSPEHYFLIGGGVLFGWFGGFCDLVDEYGFEIPDLEGAAHFTSRAYLINLYLYKLQADPELQKIEAN